MEQLITIAKFLHIWPLIEKYVLPHVAKKIEKRFGKVLITIEKIILINQTKSLSVMRLPITNDSKDSAENVQAEVIAVYDNRKKRKNFLPSTLRWANHNTDKIDIRGKRTAYLDIADFYVQSMLGGTPGPLPGDFDIDKPNKKYEELLLIPLLTGIKFYLRLCFTAGNISKFTLLKKGNTTIKIHMYIDNGDDKKFTIGIKWDGKFRVSSRVYLPKN